MIVLKRIANPENFAFIAFFVFMLLIHKEFVYKKIESVEK